MCVDPRTMPKGTLTLIYTMPANTVSGGKPTNQRYRRDNKRNNGEPRLPPGETTRARSSWNNRDHDWHGHDGLSTDGGGATLPARSWGQNKIGKLRTSDPTQPANHYTRKHVRQPSDSTIHLFGQQLFHHAATHIPTKEEQDATAGNVRQYYYRPRNIPEARQTAIEGIDMEWTCVEPDFMTAVSTPQLMVEPETSTTTTTNTRHVRSNTNDNIGGIQQKNTHARQSGGTRRHDPNHSRSREQHTRPTADTPRTSEYEQQQRYKTTHETTSGQPDMDAVIRSHEEKTWCWNGIHIPGAIQMELRAGHNTDVSSIPVTTASTRTWRTQTRSGEAYTIPARYAARSIRDQHTAHSADEWANQSIQALTEGEAQHSLGDRRQCSERPGTTTGYICLTTCNTTERRFHDTGICNGYATRGNVQRTIPLHCLSLSLSQCTTTIPTICQKPGMPPMHTQRTNKHERTERTTHNRGDKRKIQSIPRSTGSTSDVRATRRKQGYDRYVHSQPSPHKRADLDMRTSMQKPRGTTTTTRTGPGHRRLRRRKQTRHPYTLPELTGVATFTGSTAGHEDQCADQRGTKQHYTRPRRSHTSATAERRAKPEPLPGYTWNRTVFTPIARAGMLPLLCRQAHPAGGNSTAGIDTHFHPDADQSCPREKNKMHVLWRSTALVLGVENPNAAGKYIDGAKTTVDYGRTKIGRPGTHTSQATGTWYHRPRHTTSEKYQI